VATTTRRTAQRERGEGHLARPEWFWSAQMQALNTALVMILIPFNNLVLYPALRRWGVNVTPLRRMGCGIAFSGFAWIAAGAIQLAIDGGDRFQSPGGCCPMCY
jgi:POT family proton-dependent oligopeptide transporter